PARRGGAVVIEFAVGLGIALNLLSYELLGLTAGGMVVPGYLALFLDRPGRIAATFTAAVVTLAAVRLLSRYIILYGRRKYAAMILAGFLINFMLAEALVWIGPWFGPAGGELRVIGFIEPGLLGHGSARRAGSCGSSASSCRGFWPTRCTSRALCQRRPSPSFAPSSCDWRRRSCSGPGCWAVSRPHRLSGPPSGSAPRRPGRPPRPYRPARGRWRVPAAVLAAMAVIAVGAYAWWGEQAGWDGGRAMTAEEAAQEIMLRGMRAIAAAREAAGFPIDRRIDPNGTG